VNKEMENQTNLKDALAEAPPQLNVEPTPAAQPAPSTGFDVRQLATAAPKPAGPAPGSLGWHLTNAYNSPAAQVPGGATKALFSGVTDALLHGNDEKPAQPEAQSNDWQAAQANADQSRPTPAPVQNAKPGIFDNVIKALGDARGGAGQRGVIQGVLGTAGEMTDRARREQQDQVQMAHSNAEMLKEQLLVHKLGEDARAENIAQGTKSVDEMINVPASYGGENGTEDFKGKTSQELTDLINKKQINPSVQTVFATGRKQVGADKNGVPIYQTTYSVVTPPAKMTITPERAKDLNDTIGTEFSTDPEKLQVLPGVVANKYIQQASNAKVLSAAAMHANTALGLQVDNDKAIAASKDLASNGQVVGAVAHEKSSEDDPYAYVKAYNLLKNSGAFTDPKSSLNGKEQAFRLMAGAGDAKNFEKQQESFATAQEKNAEKTTDIVASALKDPAKIQSDTETVLAASASRMNDQNLTTTQRADAARVNELAKNVLKLKQDTENSKELNKEEIKAKAAQRSSALNNPQGLTGPAFIATLPPGRANTLRQFEAGTLVLNPTALERTEKGQAYLDDVYSAYPDLDASKAPAYAKLRQSFTNGKEAQELKAANTALEHLDLFDQHLKGAVVGKIGQGLQAVGMNEQVRSLADDGKAVANELAKIYVGGVAGEHSIKEWQDLLDPNTLGMTESKLRTNMIEATKLMGGKMSALQNQWDDGVPSKMITAPKNMASAKNIDVYKRITGQDMDVHPTQNASATANAPAGAIQRPADLPTATHTQQFTKNGVTKTFWADASGKPLREATDIPKE
jgi:hypothetical protein